MASRKLYPPTISSYMPAFKCNGTCRIYFSLSKFNASIDIDDTIQVSVTKQSNGMTVINPIDDGDNNIYRSNGRIILNKRKVQVKNNLYYFELTNDDIKNGQTKSWLYKVQIRLIEAGHSYDGVTRQNDQLNNNASYFSEQSTVCVLKAIGNIYLVIPTFDCDTEKDKPDPNKLKTIKGSTLEFSGSMKSEDQSEKLYSYIVDIYDKEENLIESSGELFASRYQNSNDFYFLSTIEYKENENYKLVFNYTTINGYTTLNENIDNSDGEETIYSNITSESFVQWFTVNYSENINNEITLKTVEDYINIKDNYRLTSYMQENEEGRIGLQIQTNLEIPFSGNLCIRRADEKDNFSTQTDIKIMPIVNKDLNTLDPIYDYTIESGVYYIYAIQTIDRSGIRSAIDDDNKTQKIMRDFEYSFLLGEGGKQLKLKFDNTMSSYKIQQIESKVEPIGGIFPIITRNAGIRYRIFPVTGLISFQMDENNLFCTKKDIYGVNASIHKGEKQTHPSPGEHDHKELSDNSSPSFEVDNINNITTNSFDVDIQDPYDYIYERDFRKMVMDFLYDGKPKLFKSPTEGNIIIRLTEINLTPNQSLDRMLYSFTANGNEFAEATMENYLKYKFYDKGYQVTSFAQTETKIGQIYLHEYFNLKDLLANNTVSVSSNIIKMIWDKYDSGDENLAGYQKKIQKVFGIRITIESAPMRYTQGKNTILGHQISVNSHSMAGGENKNLYIYNNIYDFDSHLAFLKGDSITFNIPQSDIKDLSSLTEEQKDQIPAKEIEATIDFFYTITSEQYLGKIKDNQESVKSIGQLYGSFTPDTDLMAIIKSKYFIDSKYKFRELAEIPSIEIEANPGVIIDVGDMDDPSLEYEQHEINTTGTLRFYNISPIMRLKYHGIRGAEEGMSPPADLMITYYYTVLKGDYIVNE